MCTFLFLTTRAFLCIIRTKSIPVYEFQFNPTWFIIEYAGRTHPPSSHTGDKAGFMVVPLLYAAPSITTCAHALHTRLQSIAMMQTFCFLFHHYNRNNQSTAFEIGDENNFYTVPKAYIRILDLLEKKTKPCRFSCMSDNIFNYSSHTGGILP